MESPTWASEDVERRDRVLELVREHIRKGLSIPYLPKLGFFCGLAGEFQYCFEGEDDLLHLIVSRRDETPLSPDATRSVARFLLPDVPEAMVWLKPGERAHHYYLGHDLLLTP